MFHSDILGTNRDHGHENHMLGMIFSLAYKRTSETWLPSICDHFNIGERRKQTFPSLVKDVKLAGTGYPGFSMSCRSDLRVDSTHTEAQSSVGLSVPDTKDQGPLAGMHIPTAAVVRPAQRIVIGIIGARQRVLMTRNIQHQQVSGGHAMHQMSDDIIKNTTKRFKAYTDKHAVNHV